ncbi:MAG: VTT domain-containing protein [Oscillospiraceae bacterium]|nr:VTT domain-containing protein [Oscillospiraceae bacterium]
MNKDPALRRKRRRSLINLIGVLLLIAAGVLVALLFFLSTPALQEWYAIYHNELQILEYSILSLPNIWVIVVAVLALYALKGVMPMPPISLMCVSTAAVLPFYLSFIVNLAGVVIVVTERYWMGHRRGRGGLHRLLSRNDTIRAFLERDDRSKPWLLFLFRLLPSFPVNPVSSIYGAMSFDYVDYVLISLLGFLPKIISYLLLGINVYQPLSPSFIIPMIIIFALSGISLLGVNLFLATSKSQKGIPS